MYHRIMVPVDLVHVERIEKALQSAADLSKHYGTPVTYVAVSATTPNEIAHTPQEHKQKLEEFARQQADTYGLHDTTAAFYTSHDPAADLDEKLLQAIEDTGSDLVVMASHIPGIPEHIFSSNAGAVASHARVSVFVIR